MDLIDTVLEGDDRSYFTFGHGEHLLLPVIETCIHLTAFSTYLTTLYDKTSFNTEEQCLNAYFYHTIYYYLNHLYGVKKS